MIPHPHSWTRSWTKFAYYLPVVNHGCHTSTLPQYTRLSTLKLSPINCDQMDTRNIMPDPSHVWPSSTAITRLTKYANCPLPQTRSNHIPYAVTRHVSPPPLPPYFHPMNIYYGQYPVETDVSDFMAISYQAEIIIHLATKPEMGWYARNMYELQQPNCTIGFMGPTRRLITHQATSWTQQL